MTMASLDASLLARKGTARPVMAKPSSAQQIPNRIQFIPQDTIVHAASVSKRSTQTERREPLGKGLQPRSAKPNTRKRKSVRLNAPTDKDLRLLAASMGVSQQALMEKAISDYLINAYKERGCICRQQN